MIEAVYAALGWALTLIASVPFVFAFGGSVPKAPPPPPPPPSKSDAEIQQEKAKAASALKRKRGRAATILGGEVENVVTSEEKKALLGG